MSPLRIAWTAALVATLTACEGGGGVGGATDLPASLGGGCADAACACGADERCDIACADGEPCAVACAEGSACAVDCGGATVCDVACEGAAVCEVDCGRSPDCRIACPAEDCTVWGCELDLGCALTCADGDAPAMSVTTVRCD